MQAGVFNDTILQGADWEVAFQLLNDDDTPVSLVGYAGRCQMRTQASSSTVVATPTVTITNAALGQVAVSLTATQTSAIEANGNSYSSTTPYAYDVELYNSGTGQVMRVLNGTLNVSPEVTR